MSEDRVRVLIVGGGVGGLETALALGDLAGDRVEMEMLSRDPSFTYRPWSVTTPFGHGAAVQVDLREVAADRGFALTEGALADVDAEAHRASTTAGDRDYDVLVLALGAAPVPCVSGAFTFRGPQDAAALRALLDEDRLADQARVTFVATGSAVWSLPAYELALQTAARARRSGRRVRVSLVTGEASPLEAFGPETSADVARLLAEQGVELHASTVPESFEDGGLFVPMAGTIPADVVVSLPALAGRPIDGVPHDAAGFVPVDDFCRVEGAEDVFAIGDMTARPLKQGGLAAQQGDVVAGMIAAACGVSHALNPYEPVLRAMLVTGQGPRYLRYPPADELRPESGTEAPWWPPHKIAGRHLGPYLATHGELLVTPASAT